MVKVSNRNSTIPYRASFSLFFSLQFIFQCNHKFLKSLTISSTYIVSTSYSFTWISCSILSLSHVSLQQQQQNFWWTWQFFIFNCQLLPSKPSCLHLKNDQVQLENSYPQFTYYLKFKPWLWNNLITSLKKMRSKTSFGYKFMGEGN